LTIWNKLKIETTHIVYRLNNVRVSQKSQRECCFVMMATVMSEQCEIQGGQRTASAAYIGT
uniref:hypothetical protein n=1 Tax=Providencia vermicola TaxID=333965 RepID=UPI0023B0380C